MRLYKCLALAGLFLFCLCSPTSANNPYGVMTMSGGDADTAGMIKHFSLSRDVVGEWGYVRIGAGFTEGEIPDLVQTITVCRALHLIPVCTGFKLPPEYYEPDNPDKPKRDPDGSLSTFEQGYEDWLRKLYSHGVTLPYFEYGNEVNGGFFAESPEVYAESLIAASRGLKRADPDMSFGTAGMAGCALDFYDEMLQKVPELKDHVDHWGFHPYAVNHPPHYTRVFDSYGLGCNAQLGELLESHGVKNPVLIATETNFELGNQRDRRFPKMTEELRAKYIVQAYDELWLTDPNVRAIMLFVLSDQRWQGWNGWDLVREDYSLTPLYEALRDVPKPQGHDYLPRGTASISGRVKDDVFDRGVEDYVVWVRQKRAAAGQDYTGLHYAAITREDGAYEISNIPSGTYEVLGYRDGFGDLQTQTVSVSDGGSVTRNQAVPRHGLLLPIEGPAGVEVPVGYTASLDGHQAVMDSQVKRSGSTSLRIDANGRPGTVWQVSAYESVLPGKAYAAEVWVKTQDLKIGDGTGASLNVQITDSYARELSTAEVPLGLEGTNDWTPITIIVQGRPEARRLWVSMKVDAAEGTVWFDDLFVHEADWPLPSAAELGQGSASVSGFVQGEVMGQDQPMYLSDAIVFTIPGGQWTRTDVLGRYLLGGLPEGVYRLAAFHPDFQSRLVDLVIPEEGAEAQIVLEEPTALPALVNGDFEQEITHPTWFRNWNRFGTAEGMQVAGWHKGLPEHPEGFQPHSGDGFYGAVAGSNIKDGGIFQTVQVEQNALYEVSVWSYTYQTGEGMRGDVANRLGVDPTGGKDPESPYVLWTPLRPSHKEWSRISLLVRPVRPKMTVYLHHLQVHGLTFNVNLFDDVVIRKVGPPESGPEAGLE